MNGLGPMSLFVTDEPAPASSDIAAFILFLRHLDQGVRPHLVWIVEVVADVRIVLIGPVRVFFWIW